MNLQRMSDDALDAELKRQAQIQRKHSPSTQMWLAANRIIHHLSAEKERRAVAKGEPACNG